MLDEYIEYDKSKTKVLKYVLYKKRTESEVRRKFNNIIDENMLDDIISELKENFYINDKQYMIRAISEFIALNKISIKEIKYKMMSKGVKPSIIEECISENYDDLNAHELDSAIKIVNKKRNSITDDEIKLYLMKKGYSSNNIEEALNNE